MDCEWGEWEIGKCSLTCGTGIQVKTRKQKVEVSHGGKECDGFSNVTQDCNIQSCPGNHILLKYLR